ncbi:MAG TPA: hypothetical protein VLE50_00080 [Cellvibrio sp.]|jgi:hypothetical protein|nr:hypothetical protein [Cellvibrio sp.]
MSLPTHCGMPPLLQNIEGLRLHAILLNTLIPEPEIPDTQRKWRSWLVHCLVKAARHYDQARELIIAQLKEEELAKSEVGRERPLHIINFPFEIEDCITSLAKLVLCINALENNGDIQHTNISGLKREAISLNEFRNQQEHMHGQIASGQTGNGPIFACLTDDSDGFRFRKLEMPFSVVYQLIDAAYRDISRLFPRFNQESVPTRKGAPRFSLSAEVIFKEGTT